MAKVVLKVDVELMPFLEEMLHSARVYYQLANRYQAQPDAEARKLALAGALANLGIDALSYAEQEEKGSKAADLAFRAGKVAARAHQAAKAPTCCETHGKPRRSGQRWVHPLNGVASLVCDQRKAKKGKR